MVTPLIHLDLVSDIKTLAFLHMLRRFFARGLIPEVIINDNAPTFFLGENIINQCLAAARVGQR